MNEKKIRIKNLEELINQPRLVKYNTYEFDELSYTCLLVDIKMLLKENKKYKEVINKAIELLGNYKHYSTPNEEQNSDNEDLVNKAFNILKEVEDKWVKKKD